MTFELQLNSNGHPVIKFTHQDKSSKLEEQILGVFIKMAKENGLRLVNPSGYISTSGGSQEDYEITAEK